MALHDVFAFLVDAVGGEIYSYSIVLVIVDWKGCPCCIVLLATSC